MNKIRFLSSDLVKPVKKVYAYDYMVNIFKEVELKKEKKEKEKVKPEEEVKEPIEDSNGYIGYISIPKINLQKGLVNKTSPENDVEKNIFTASNSTYPDQKNNNLILAAHSGYGYKAIFNELYQLNKGDIVEITYKSKIYTYKIDNIYKELKKGVIAIYRDYNKSTLTLVTCTNNDDTTQTVYIAYLDGIRSV